MRNYIEVRATLFLTVGIKIVFGQDDFGNQNVELEYSNVFKNIPTLFEYLLDTLEEKPEVLEKNDADMFKASEDDTIDNVIRFERSIKAKEFALGTEASIENEELKERTVSNRIYEDISSKEQNIDGDNAMKDGNDNKGELNGNKKKVEERSTDEKETSKEEDMKDTQDVLWPLDEDTDKIFRLTSEEIAEQALKVEEMLENHKTRK